MNRRQAPELAGKYSIGRFREGGKAPAPRPSRFLRIGLQSPRACVGNLRANRVGSSIGTVRTPLRQCACKNRLPAFHCTGVKPRRIPAARGW